MVLIQHSVPSRPSLSNTGRQNESRICCRSRHSNTSAIAGSSVLATVGVAGVVTMGVGIARSGSCEERDANGTCATERAASAWTGVYGALGIAALAGSVTWLAVSSKRAKEKRNTAWMLTPAGVVVAGSF